MDHSLENHSMGLHRNLDSSAGDPISQILKNSRTIAVVGLSSRQHPPKLWRLSIHAVGGLSHHSGESRRN